MLAARNQTLGMIELPAQSTLFGSASPSCQDETLAALFERLGQGGEVCLIASSGRRSRMESRRLQDPAVALGPGFAVADLITLEIELEQELSRVSSRLQPSRL